MIENFSTFNTIKTLQGQDMIYNITQTGTLFMVFTDLLWNIGAGIVSSVLLT